MSIKKTLNALFKEIIQEAEANPTFRARLEAVLELKEKLPAAADAQPRETVLSQPKRPRNRRPPAALDPVHFARQGERVLREELAKLDIEQLRDVVADYGMDTGKLVLKWRDPERIIERIVEVSRARAQKGSAFRDQAADHDRVDRPTESGMRDGRAQSET